MPGMDLNMNVDSRKPLLENTCCPIVELRQYTLHPGQRDILIDLFDREFVETQEAVGIKVIGQFRDLDDPDRFVWLRGFDDMPSRAQALGAFYGGPVWKKHREAANATMIDSDNVLLLRPASPASGFRPENAMPRPPTTGNMPGGLVTATIYYLNKSNIDFADFFERTLRPFFVEAGASIIACLATEESANSFPALPVREGEKVFIWFALFQDQARHEHYARTVAGSRAWRGRVSKALASRIKGHPEILRLLPTSRSQIHG